MEKVKINPVVWDRLADEQSRQFYQAQIEYVNGNEYPLFDLFAQDYKEEMLQSWGIERLTACDSNFVIFGAGKLGSYDSYILRMSKFAERLVGLVDNAPEKWGQEMHGLKILPPTALLDECADCTILVSPLSPDIQRKICDQLLQMGIKKERIVVLDIFREFIHTKEQYFDVFPPLNDQEIFVDAGCYDGQTATTFFDWCKGIYSKSYAFEPSVSMVEKIQKNLNEKGIQNYQIINKAVWSGKETLYFNIDMKNDSSPAGHVCESHTHTHTHTADSFSVDYTCKSSEFAVEAISIDEVLEGEAVTFIKMDIEGSELEALRGAKNTILKYRPRLAICIYHKPEDIYQIPEYILSLHPDYQLYIRHYTTGIGETVLYAV